MSAYALASPPSAYAAEYGRRHYSSEQFSNSYRTPTCSPSDPPGLKWAQTRFSSGIRPSASNERYKAMRADMEDVRPFAGAPFDPRNTFATMGPSRKGYPTHMTGVIKREPPLLPGTHDRAAATHYPAPTSLMRPQTAPSTVRMSWAVMKACR